MKKSLRFLLVLVTLVTISVSSYASHIAGGSITYTQTGPNEYYITACFYRDNTGINMPQTLNLEANSSCWSGTITVTLQLPFNANNPPDSIDVDLTDCFPGQTQSWGTYCYEGTLTLPVACNDWIISWSTCCRNGAITNLVNGDSQSNFAYALINNLDAPNNSSPVFSNTLMTASCIGQETYVDLGIVDLDGDSLVISLTCPLGTGPNDCLAFISPYSATCPFPTTPPCTIDLNPSTGIMNFTPAQAGVFVFSILVQEYDQNGVLIGETIRDVQMEVGTAVACNNIIPDPIGPIYLTCDDISLIYEFDTVGLKVPVHCASIDTDGSDFRLEGPSTNPSLIPIQSATALNCVDGLTNQVQLILFEPLKNGTYDLYIKVGNDGNTITSKCGYAMAEFTTIQVIVNDTTKLAADSLTIDCATNSVTLSYPEGFDCSTLSIDESDFILIDENGNQYNITSITAPDCINNAEYGYQLQLTFDFGGNIPDSLYLQVVTGTDNNTIANRCGNFSDDNDNLAVVDVNGFIPLTLGPDLNICDYDPFPVLDANVTATDYSWTLNFDPTVIGTGQTYQPIQSGTYVVVASDQSCVGSDTVQVFVTPSPQINLGPDMTYCTGDVPQDLDATFAGPTPTYNWTLNGTQISTQPTVTPGQTGLYIVEVNVGAQCLGYDSVYVEFVQQLTLTVTGIDTLCTDESGTIEVINPGPNFDTYQWTLNGNPIGGNSQMLTVNEGGLYSVLVTTATGCTGTQNFSVASSTYPAAPTISCASVENGTYIYTWNSIPDATYYQVSLDGGATWIDVTSNSTEFQTTTLANVIVRGLNDSKCSPGVISLPTVCIDEILEVIIPNIITPAIEDDKNDAFFIRNLIYYPDNTIQIFNRWGKLVYEKSRYGLDGFWWTGGDDVSGGVYFYVLNLADGTDPRTGTITVVK